PGGPEVLSLEDRPDPAPGDGEVLVDVGAAGVNYIDVYHRTGKYPLPTPFVAGSEGAGVVSGVGRGVEGVAIGDRVAWAMVPGAGYAERVVVPAARLVPVPDGVDLEVAAALMLQGMTVHYLVTSTYPVDEGTVALVHAAAGGVGLLLTQAAVARGARVIGTASTEQKVRLAERAGASDVIRYDLADVPAEVRRLTEGRGVDVVYDGVGAATWDGSLDSLRPRGLMVLYGAASGAPAPMDPNVLNGKGSLFLTRPSLAHHISTREELLRRAGDVFAWATSGALDVHIGARYGLADAPQAHADLEARRTTGKSLVLPGR
ncbi:MAG TPA: quinone oxidoreductase, partial [Mycobacteriales bacterium]|nr:quinone oxidoreductase [Mycobacteriales bacterium]